MSVPTSSPSYPISRLTSSGGADDFAIKRGGSVAGFVDPSAAPSDGLKGAAFLHVTPRAMPLPVLIAVPHAGRAYPGEVLADMRDAGQSQLRLEDRYVDAVGVEVARATGTGLLMAEAPRAMLDLNRSAEDVDWEMISPKPQTMRRPQQAPGGKNARARSGLGLVPRRLPGFGEIWRPKPLNAELERRIDQIHRPYHSFLAAELERIRDEWGAALLIDLHSMPPLRRPSAEQQAPQIVLGDRYGSSCHSVLASRAFRFLDAQGCSAWHNRPYSGGYVLDRHAKPSRGIHCMQVELCRSTYLDAALAEPVPALKPMADLLAGLVRELGAQTARLGSQGQMAQAAE